MPGKSIGHIRQSPNDAGIHLFREASPFIFISFASIITKALGAACLRQRAVEKIKPILNYYEVVPFSQPAVYSASVNLT
jgi:hypothetical protein